MKLTDAQFLMLKDCDRDHPLGRPVWRYLHRKPLKRLIGLGYIKNLNGFAIVTNAGRAALAEQKDRTNG